jgi:hypothetical protein
MQSCGFNKEGFGNKKSQERRRRIQCCGINPLTHLFTSQQLCQRQSESARPNLLSEQVGIDELEVNRVVFLNQSPLRWFPYLFDSRFSMQKRVSLSQQAKMSILWTHQGERSETKARQCA